MEFNYKGRMVRYDTGSTIHTALRRSAMDEMNLESQLRQAMVHAQHALRDAEERLDNGWNLNEQGILQSTGMQVDNLVGRLAEVQRKTRMLANLGGISLNNDDL